LQAVEFTCRYPGCSHLNAFVESTDEARQKAKELMKKKGKQP
jgi:hypothetical protein